VSVLVLPTWDPRLFGAGGLVEVWCFGAGGCAWLCSWDVVAYICWFLLAVGGRIVVCWATCCLVFELVDH